MDVEPAPMAVLELLACACKKECNLNGKDDDCTCMQNKLKCTDMCKLKDCKNQGGDNDGDDLTRIHDMDDDETDYLDEL